MEVGMIAPTVQHNPCTVHKSPGESRPMTTLTSLDVQHLQTHIAKLETKIDWLSVNTPRRHQGSQSNSPPMPASQSRKRLSAKHGLECY